MIPKKINRMLMLIYTALDGTKTFIIAIATLTLQSVWLAFSAIYPLPFDEYYHVGLIQLYAKQWLPFISAQPAEAAIYGDITRLPSYLFHYLMSFPYRFFDLFIESETLLIIVMRLINIALVVLAIIVFRKLFLKAKISPRIINVATLFFVVTPIVPLLTSHVNYDNLLLVITAATFYVAYSLISEKRPRAVKVAGLLSLGMVGALVKYTFLPLFLGIIGVTLLFLAKTHKRTLPKLILQSWKQTKRTVKIAIVASFVLMGGLFVERIGINMLVYKNPSPNCIKVQPFEVCEQNMPWYRDYSVGKSLEGKPLPYGNPVSYSQHWVSVVMRGYYAIFSHNPTIAFWEKEPFGPIVWRNLLPIQITVAYSLLGLTLLMLIIRFRKLRITNFGWLVLLPAFFYTAVLWVFNYTSYLDVGKAYAIQARYTLPFLLPLFVVLLLLLSQTKLLKKSQKVALATIVLLVYAWGGGIAGWVIRSDYLWYWQNTTVISVNESAQKFLKMIVPH